MINFLTGLNFIIMGMVGPFNGPTFHKYVHAQPEWFLRYEELSTFQ